MKKIIKKTTSATRQPMTMKAAMAEIDDLSGERIASPTAPSTPAPVDHREEILRQRSAQVAAIYQGTRLP